jgi:hypothetical protein
MARMTAQAVLVIRRMFSAMALKTTRDGACAPLAQAHRVHLGNDAIQAKVAGTPKLRRMLVSRE